jgi:hypothetical protein
MSAIAPRSALPPVTQMASASLALVVVGGIVMASSFPSKPNLAIPIACLALSAVLLATTAVRLARQPGFAWSTFILVAKWALLAYVVEAGMIEFSFAHNHAGGAPLVVISLMLIVFALDVPVLIAFTVARYQRV